MNILDLLKLKRKHGLRINGVYKGVLCEVCGAIVKGGTKTMHYQTSHPEYQIRNVFVNGAWHTWCGVCGRSIASPGAIVKHYQEKHPISERPVLIAE